MHDRSDLGSVLKAIAGGFIALLALLVCLMVAMAVGTARGADPAEEPSRAKILTVRDPNTFIQDGPEPFRRVEVVSRAQPLIVPLPDGTVVSEIPPPVTVIDEIPIGVDACFDSITDCRQLVADRCTAHGGTSSAPRRGARLAVCDRGGEAVVCCTGDCADGTTIECKASR